MQTLQFILLTLTTLWLQGCVPAAVIGVVGGTTTTVVNRATEERGLGGVLSDAAIQSQIKEQMEQMPGQLLNDVDVFVFGRQVLLTGRVPTEKMQIDAVRAAWQISSVQDVMDEITVAPPQSFSQQSADKWMTTKVNTQIVFNKNIASNNYKIHVKDGIIYVLGIAQNQGELDEVLHIASTIDDQVKKVVNRVTLKSNPIPYGT